MTTDTLPPLTDEDGDDIGSALIAEVYAMGWLRPAVKALHEALSAPVAEWDAWLYVRSSRSGLDELLFVTTGRPMDEAKFVSDEWVRTHELGPDEHVFSVALVADRLLDQRVREIMAAVDRQDELDAHQHHDIRVSWRTRLLGVVIGMAILAVVLVGGFAIAAQQAGAAQPSCSLSVRVNGEGKTMTFRYVPPDDIARTVWVHGQPYTLKPNGSVTVKYADAYEYPTSGNWIGTAETVAMCSPQPTTTTKPAPTTSTTQAPTTTTSTAPAPTTSTTSTPATTTTEPVVPPAPPTTAQPPVSLPPATSTSVLSTATTLTTHAVTPAPTTPAPATPDAGPVPSTVPSTVDAPAGELPRTGLDWSTLRDIAGILILLGLGLWALRVMVDPR